MLPRTLLPRLTHWDREQKAYLWLLTLSALFLAANLVTASRYPAVWVDEIEFADPAVNFVLSGHFISTVWFAQDSHAFWAGNCPLYTFLLIPWIKIFGVSAMAVRSLNYFLTVVLVWLAWELTKRNGWIESPRWRLVLVAILWTEQGITFSYRTGRYDATGAVLCMLAASAWSRLRGTKRNLVLAGIAFFFPLAGLQVVAFVVVFCVILLFFTGRKELAPAISVCVGMAIGAGALYVLYASHGVWENFVNSTHSLRGAGLPLAQRIQWQIKQFPAVMVRDKSLVLLLAGALLIVVTRHARKLLIFSVVAALVVPSAMNAIGKFPIYYFWMAAVPLAIGIVAQLGMEGRERLRPLIMVLLVLASLCGFPMRLAAVAMNWNSLDQRPIQQFVKQYLSPGDFVIADFKAYYAVKKHARALYAPTYVGIMTDDERQRITALLVRPDQLSLITPNLGGTWQDTGLSMPGSRMHIPLLLKLMADFRQEQYEVHLYRRSDN